MSNFTIIDGGMSTELMSMGFVIDSDPLWSARLLETSPDSILKAHANFIKSGSEIVTTASYQATIEGFVKYLEISVEDAKTLIASSVTLAKLATEGTNVKVSASLGPYGASQADGSEYQGNYVDAMSIEELMNFHRPKMEILVNAGCDMLALETVPALKEGVALIRLLKEFPNSKAWLSFTCKDNHNTSHGESFQTTVNTCLQELTNPNQLLAIGVNCCSPDFVQSLLEDAGKAKMNPDIKFIAYPNSGATWISRVGWNTNGDLRKLHSYVPDWINSGVTWFGGCCQTDSQDIAQLVKTLSKY